MARRTKSTEEAITAIEQFSKEQGCRVFKPAIRLAVDAADAPSFGKSLHAYKPNSDVTKDYEHLAATVLEALGG